MNSESESFSFPPGLLKRYIEDLKLDKIPTELNRDQAQYIFFSGFHDFLNINIAIEQLGPLAAYILDHGDKLDDKDFSVILESTSQLSSLIRAIQQKESNESLLYKSTFNNVWLYYKEHGSILKELWEKDMNIDKPVGRVTMFPAKRFKKHIKELAYPANPEECTIEQRSIMLTKMLDDFYQYKINTEELCAVGNFYLHAGTKDLSQKYWDFFYNTAELWYSVRFDVDSFVQVMADLHNCYKNKKIENR